MSLARPTRITIAVVLVLIALACAAEALLRFREARASEQLGSRSIEYYQHANLQRAFVRGRDYFGRIHINRHGLRGPEFDARKTPGTTRILVTGASAAFDACAARDAETWPARLEHWLDSLSPADSVEVLNAGVPGSTMLDAIVRMQTELWAFQPDMVLLYAGHGSVGRDEVTRMRRSPRGTGSGSADMPNAAETATPWGSWLTRNSRLYNRITRRKPTGSSDSEPVTDSVWRAGLEYTLDEFRRDLSTFVSIARFTGAKVVIVELAHVGSDQATLSDANRATWGNSFVAPADIVVGSFPRFSDLQRAIADSLGASFIPTRTFGIASREHFCSGDALHLSRSGADLMGRRLAEYMLAADIVNGGRGAASAAAPGRRDPASPGAGAPPTNAQRPRPRPR